MENSGRFFLVDGQNIITSIFPIRQNLSTIPTFLELYGETLEVKIEGVMAKGFTHAYMIGDESVKEEVLLKAITEACETNKVEFIYFNIKGFDEGDNRFLFSTIKNIRKKTGRIIGLEYQDSLSLSIFQDFYMNGVDFVGINERHKQIEDDLLELLGNLGIAHMIKLTTLEESIQIEDAFHFIEKGITPLITLDRFDREKYSTVLKNMKELDIYLEKNQKKFKCLPTRNRFLSPYNLCQLFESNTNYDSLKRSIERNLITGKSFASLMEMKRTLRVKKTDSSLESSGL